MEERALDRHPTPADLPETVTCATERHAALGTPGESTRLDGHNPSLARRLHSANMMDDKHSMRRLRSRASTVAYGMSPSRFVTGSPVAPSSIAPGPAPVSARFAPPTEASLPAVRPSPETTGTMAPPRRASWKFGGGVLPAIITTAMVIIAIVSNLERAQGLWCQFFPPDDDVELMGAIPLMLFVRSDPPGSRVFINGRRVGRTPYAQGYGASGGTVHVRLEAPRHQPWMADLELKKAGVSVNAKLKRLRPNLKPMRLGLRACQRRHYLHSPEHRLDWHS